MSISYEGIGEWCATFVCGAVSEGDIVKVSANGTVGKCTAGDGFCGVVRAVAHDGLVAWLNWRFVGQKTVFMQRHKVQLLALNPEEGRTHMHPFIRHADIATHRSAERPFKRHAQLSSGR